MWGNPSGVPGRPVLGHEPAFPVSSKVMQRSTNHTGVGDWRLCPPTSEAEPNSWKSFALKEIQEPDPRKNSSFPPSIGGAWPPQVVVVKLQINLVKWSQMFSHRPLFLMQWPAFPEYLLCASPCFPIEWHAGSLWIWSHLGSESKTDLGAASLPFVHMPGACGTVRGKTWLYTHFHAEFPSLVMWFWGSQLLGGPGRDVQEVS